MRFRLPAASLIVLPIILLVGCSGPTRTAGTSGVAAKDLSVLSISQLPEEAHIEIKSVQFDGKGDAYKIDKSRDFYLTPGDHTASFTLVARVPKMEGMAGLASWLIPKNAVTIPSPTEVPLGAVAAGKSYQLSPPTLESFDKLLQDGGSLSLMQEKSK